MQQVNKVLLLEFNELSPFLLDKWMGEGKLPNFKKFHDNSMVYVSKPDVEESELLEPWIQWFSMHVGVGYQEHKVFHLTDGEKANNLDIWSHLNNNDKKVASFASMNVKNFKGEGNLFLPDPWCTSGGVMPNELNIYQRFVSSMVQEHTNENKKISIGECFSFLFFMIKRGLSFKTITAIIKQLAKEKLSKKDLYWQRVALLDRLQLDVFKSYYKNNNFHFATFFSNSTAHLQHAYWRFMEPEAFVNKPSAEDMENYKDAVFFGYAKMDKMLEEISDVVDDNTLVILASALSQQPYLKKEEIGGQMFYRPKNVQDMLSSMDIYPEEIQATMTHQYMLRFKDKIDAETAKQKLLSWSFEDNQPLFGIDERGEENSIYFGNQISQLIDENAEIYDHYNDRKVKYSKYFYRIKEVKSGGHHPDGILWFRTGHHTKNDKQVSILDVFPTVLDFLDVSHPECIAGRGKSIMQDL